MDHQTLIVRLEQQDEGLVEETIPSVAVRSHQGQQNEDAGRLGADSARPNPVDVGGRGGPTTQAGVAQLHCPQPQGRSDTGARVGSRRGEAFARIKDAIAQARPKGRIARDVFALRPRQSGAGAQFAHAQGNSASLNLFHRDIAVNESA